MPAADEVLRSLRAIASDAFALAVVWHAVLALAGVALLLGWRPWRRTAGLLVMLPAASVSALAFASANPLNGAVFALLCLGLAAAALRMARAPAALGPSWAVWVGAGMIAFGWLYPHFLENRSAFVYLYGAPTGLLPCPTLAAMIGLTLVSGGLGSRLYCLALAAAGVLYGILGAAWLGVHIDLTLILGALALLLLALPAPRRVPGVLEAGSRG